MYKIGENSSIVQRKFCCTKCQSTNKGHFSYTYVDEDKLNYFIEGSLFDVGNESVGESAIYADGGHIVVSSTNFSSNTATSDSAGYFTIMTVNIITKFHYSTVVNNLATSFYDIIYFKYNALIDSCNIIRNKISKTGGIIYQGSDVLTVKGCSFINNSAPNNAYLIYNSAKLIIDSSYIDKTISHTYRGGAELKNSRYLFTNNLTHPSFGNCQAEFAVIKKSIRKINKPSLSFITFLKTKHS